MRTLNGLTTDQHAELTAVLTRICGITGKKDLYMSEYPPHRAFQGGAIEFYLEFHITGEEADESTTSDRVR